jgi:hypothetical protein
MKAKKLIFFFYISFLLIIFPFTIRRQYGPFFALFREMAEGKMSSNNSLKKLVYNQEKAIYLQSQKKL